MPGSNLFSKLTSTVDIALTDSNDLGMFIRTTGAPPTTANVFQAGCVAIRTDSGSGSTGFYENIGTSAVPSWDLVGAISAGEISLTEGQLLVGNSSGVAAASSDGVVNLVATNASAAGVAIVGDHTSASPAIGDQILILQGNGKDDGAATQTYGFLAVTIEDPTNGSEAGSIELRVADTSGALKLSTKGHHDGTNGIVGAGDEAAAGVFQSNGDFDAILRTGNSTTGNVTITDGANGNIALTPNGSGAIDLVGALLYTDITTSSGPAAVAITGLVHEVTTTGLGDAMTMADGVNGQRLTVLYVAETAGPDSFIITPTTLAGANTTITVQDVGDAVDLQFKSTVGWFAIGGNYTLG